MSLDYICHWPVSCWEGRRNVTNFFSVARRQSETCKFLLKKGCLASSTILKLFILYTITRPVFLFTQKCFWEGSLWPGTFQTDLLDFCGFCWLAFIWKCAQLASFRSSRRWTSKESWRAINSKDMDLASDGSCRTLGWKRPVKYL